MLGDLILTCFCWVSSFWCIFVFLNFRKWTKSPLHPTLVWYFILLFLFEISYSFSFFLIFNTIYLLKIKNVKKNKHILFWFFLIANNRRRPLSKYIVGDRNTRSSYSQCTNKKTICNIYEHYNKKSPLFLFCNCVIDLIDSQNIRSIKLGV